MIELPLTSKCYPGLVALVDDEDYAMVNEFKWFPFPNGNPEMGLFYAQANLKRGGKWTSLKMHKLITGYARTDHRSGNGLDNRRENLRAATTSQNQANSRKGHGHTSQFKGVSLDRGHWRAAITLNGKRAHLGRFSSEIEAAKAYDRAALERFGEFALPNFSACVEVKGRV